MQSVTYAFVGPEEAATKWAKKGTASDVTLYNAKSGDRHLNLVAPTRYPEKLSSLLVALDVADALLLQPAALDRFFGETLVGASLFGKTRGFLRAVGSVSPDAARPLLAQIGLKDLDVTSEGEATLRERLYELASTGTDGPPIVPVDHAFPVKGVGTVILGLVRSGTVKPHQQLQAYPGVKTIDVRSVQVHDVDVDSAPGRARVGLAVKGVEASDLPRGTVLAPPGLLTTTTPETTFDAAVEFTPFVKWTPRAGAALHFFHCLQDVVVRVEAVGAATPASGTMTVRAEAPFVHVPGQPAVLVDLDNARQRFIGRLHLPG